MHLFYRFADRTVNQRNIRVYDMLQCCEVGDGRLELLELLSHVPSLLHQALGKECNVEC